MLAIRPARPPPIITIALCGFKLLAVYKLFKKIDNTANPEMQLYVYHTRFEYLRVWKLLGNPWKITP